VRLEVGRIAAAHGIRGEVRVLLEDPDIPLDGRTLCVEGEDSPRRVLRMRPWKAGAILALEGLTDRSAAETLQGRGLYTDSEGLPSLEGDRYYVHELIGFSVEDEQGTVLGEIRAVEPRPAQDLWVAEGERGTYLIPAVRATVLSVDRLGRRITVRGGGVLGPDTAD